MSYRMIRERLIVQISPLSGEVTTSGGLLCSVHADRMTVPRDWVIDDLRDQHPRLFRGQHEVTTTRRRSTRRHAAPAVESEQLELSEGSVSAEDEQGDGLSAATRSPEAEAEATATPPLSPLLGRAFRGTRLEH